MHEFDEDTAVHASGDGRFSAEVTSRWGIGGERPNGGYLMAIGTRALAETLPHPDPVTVTAHFLRSPEPGPVDVDVELVRKGRRLSFGQCSVTRDGVEFLRVTAAFGQLQPAGTASWQALAVPELPPLEDCAHRPEGIPGVTISQRFDVRFDPACIGWLRGEASGRGELAAWIRFADGREADLLGLIQVVDALPPSVFDLGVVDAVPTVELTTHLRAHPAPGWLRCVARTRHIADGFVEEDVEIWDAEDRLVVQARQLALLVGGG